jgi:hypothetical protein
MFSTEPMSTSSQSSSVQGEEDVQQHMLGAVNWSGKAVCQFSVQFHDKREDEK